MVCRLKSMYVLLGGNIHEINAESELENMTKAPIEDNQELRKKGRPKKNLNRKSVNTSVKYFDKL